MTPLQANQLVQARQRMQQSRREFEFAKLRETRYRGIPTISDGSKPQPVSGTFTYRGVEYAR